MIRDPAKHRLLVVVGAGGVGKTTLAAALGVASARAGRRSLVMTFDPSRRLKDTLSVGDAAARKPVAVETEGPATLHASLLDARWTFDRLVDRYAPDEAARRRIRDNRFYRRLRGNLAGILEYMAVERLYEVAQETRYERIVLDTPPTAQALDFIEAPDRITGFLNSGAVRFASRSWFDESGRLRPAKHLGWLGRGLERMLDEMVGLDLLRDLSEFIQAFDPLYEGFRSRAEAVRHLLRSRETLFVLVAGPGRERVPETMFFARRLEEAGYRVGPVIVNRVHPPAAVELAADGDPGEALLRWLGERDRRGLEELRDLIRPPHYVVEVPMLERAPVDVPALARLGGSLSAGLTAALPTGTRT